MTARPTCDQSVISQWLDACLPEQPAAAIPASPESQLCTPPISTSSNPRKHLRAMSEARSMSPQKRQRTRCEDDVLSEVSVSDVAVTELSERTRLSQPSVAGRTAPKRATSPVRDLLNDLRVSTPAVLCEIPASTTLPPHASALQHTLMGCLEEAFIPLGLKDRILELHPSVAASIPSSSYDASDMSTPPELDALWGCVQEILNDSKDCGRYQQDENAWCIKVVHPLLRLALKRGSKLKVESVQTQTINPDVLPITPRNYRVQRKADFTFSFHRDTPEASALYTKLGVAGVGDSISQTMDANTKRLALFSGIEVKQENGGKDEALVQLAIWLAAGLENTRRLGEVGQKQSYPPDDLKPTVGWTVIGHDWHTYIAYMVTEDGRNVFKVVGPWRVAAADTRDVFGIFKLLRLVSNAAAFASNEYWNWLQDDILKPYATYRT